MIQRIQSVFLLAIILLSVLLLFIPFEIISAGDKNLALSLMPSSLDPMIKPLFYVPVCVNLGVCVLSLICVFLYNNRKRQMRICVVILALSIGLNMNLLVADMRLGDLANAEVSRTAAAFFPLANVVFAVLARRFIKKDEDLVRSADRIR